MYRRGSRKQDIEMFIKMHILNGEVKKAIDLCEKYGITAKRFGQLVKQVEEVCHVPYAREVIATHKF